MLKFHYLKSCGDNNIITIKDAGSTMDKQCNISPAGCVSAKAFTTATVNSVQNNMSNIFTSVNDQLFNFCTQMHYRAEKKPLPAIEGDMNLCKALADKNEYAMLATGALGLPQTCPVEDVSFNVFF